MKGEYEIRDIIYQFQKEISYYSQMEAFGATPYEKNYNQNLIKERTEEVIKSMEQYIAKANKATSQQIPENIPESVPESVPELPPEIAPPPAPISEPSTAPEAGPATPGTPAAGEQRSFTLEELKTYNGSGNNPAYVAIDGIVYDLSMRIGWAGGTHFGLYSGNDLTRQFMACHGGLVSILEQLPVVGVLISE